MALHSAQLVRIFLLGGSISMTSRLQASESKHAKGRTPMRVTQAVKFIETSQNNSAQATSGLTWTAEIRGRGPEIHPTLASITSLPFGGHLSITLAPHYPIILSVSPIGGHLSRALAKKQWSILARQHQYAQPAEMKYRLPIHRKALTPTTSPPVHH